MNDLFLSILFTIDVAPQLRNYSRSFEFHFALFFFFIIHLYTYETMALFIVLQFSFLLMPSFRWLKCGASENIWCTPIMAYMYLVKQ